MFLGWLLDPKGSHGFGSFALQRILLAIADDRTRRGRKSPDSREIERLAALGILVDANVTPNEQAQQEKTVPGVGRIDVFADNMKTETEADAVLLVEQKVNARIDPSQCKKYADWLEGQYPDALRILVLLAPSESVGATFIETVGDDRWRMMDYQALHDLVLVPLLRSSRLTPGTKPLIEQYVDLLRGPGQSRKCMGPEASEEGEITAKGRRLAVIEEEKKLAMELYEQHKDALETIAMAIEPDDADLSKRILQKQASLCLYVDSKAISGRTVPEFFLSALKHILLHRRELGIDERLPYGTGPKRYLIATTPQHRDGSDFLSPVEEDGLFMETNKGKEQATRDLIRLFEDLGAKVLQHPPNEEA